MGLFSAIAGFIGGICSAIGSVCSAIGLGSLGTVLTAAITALNPIVGLIMAAIPLVLQILKILAPNEVKPEEIENGELAVKAEACKDDIKPENYKTHSEYIQAVRESVENDPEKKAWVDEKMKTLSPEDLTVYKCISVGMAGQLVAEKLGTEAVDPAFLAKANAIGLDAEKTISLIKGLSDQGVSTNNASKYFEGNLESADFEKAGESIKFVMGKIDPSLSVNSMSEKIDAAIKSEQ